MFPEGIGGFFPGVDDTAEDGRGVDGFEFGFFDAVWRVTTDAAGEDAGFERVLVALQEFAGEKTGGGHATAEHDFSSRFCPSSTGDIGTSEVNHSVDGIGLREVKLIGSGVPSDYVFAVLWIAARDFGDAMTVECEHCAKLFADESRRAGHEDVHGFDVGQLDASVEVGGEDLMTIGEGSAKIVFEKSPGDEIAQWRKGQ